MAERYSTPQDLRSRSTADLTGDVMQQSREAMQAGARATEELTELERRGREALDWRKQAREHPWAAAAVGLGAGLLIWALFFKD